MPKAPKAPKNPSVPSAPRKKVKKFSRLDMDEEEGTWGIWTEDQREFMVSQLPLYGEYSEKKDFALFWPDFQSKWYHRWPELKFLFPELLENAELTEFQRDAVERGIQFRNVKTNAAMRWAFRNGITRTRSISGRSATMLDRILGSNSRCNKNWEWFCKLYYDTEVGPEVNIILGAIEGTPTGGQILDAVRSVAQRKLRDGPQSVRDEIEEKKDQQKVVLAGPTPASNDPKLNALAARAVTMTLMPTITEIHEYASTQTIGGKSIDGFRFATMVVGRDPLTGKMCAGSIHVGLNQSGLDFGQVSQSWKRCTEEFAAFANAPGRPVEISVQGKKGEGTHESPGANDEGATAAEVLLPNEDKADDITMAIAGLHTLEAAMATDEPGHQDATSDTLSRSGSNVHALDTLQGKDSIDMGIAAICQNNEHDLSLGNTSDSSDGQNAAPMHFDPSFFDVGDYSWLDDLQVQQVLSHLGSTEDQFHQYGHTEPSEASCQANFQFDMNMPIDLATAQPLQPPLYSQPDISPDFDFPALLHLSMPGSAFLPQDPGPPHVPGRTEAYSAQPVCNSSIASASDESNVVTISRYASSTLAFSSNNSSAVILSHTNPVSGIVALSVSSSLSGACLYYSLANVLLRASAISYAGDYPRNVEAHVEPNACQVQPEGR
ncbi:hypothetical protein CONPUDRAFT_77943 [Coniophora puteana RWD-64-598 SS2]|uniref:Uncharacterized protein n=1 Tax=Coniophora puteana (strain RWD-64-598) TaxID=741705 RepID=R7SER7_CONPW|nr:uncharacterized protein CONPUDRAFT_77943 [Coniophora puteana RWD-64-598 SS2]EIW74671.1 hypothetical protein CONPUDRAFT_77943 [Coniophora puteana RWD-64-598 SS2]